MGDLNLDKAIGDEEDEDLKGVLELLIDKIVIDKGVIDIRWNF